MKIGYGLDLNTDGRQLEQIATELIQMKFTSCILKNIRNVTDWYGHCQYFTITVKILNIGTCMSEQTV